MTEVSTSTPMLPPPPPPPSAWAADPVVRWTRRVVAVILVLLGLIGLTLVIPAQALGRVVPGQALIDQGTVAQKPGAARPTAGRVFIDIDEVFQPDGQILFTTVSLDTDVTIWDWFWSEFDDDIELKTREQVFGSRSLAENRARNLELMSASKDSAILAAFAGLGLTVVEETGIAFEEVVEAGPVDGSLVVGDVIIDIDGSPITSFQSLRDALDTKVPGEPGVITVDNIDTLEIREVEVVWGIHPDGLPGGFIGIGSVVVRANDLPLPFDVEIDSGSIGGPSAGLAFALTIIDLLTEGELTGGQNIAVTGTIMAGGDVGPVGGVGQKAAAANNAGAVAFIVPIDVADIARAHAGDMPVIGVANLDEALAALTDLGGETDDLRLLIG